jgi:hypothetical protein
MEPLRRPQQQPESARPQALGGKEHQRNRHLQGIVQQLTGERGGSFSPTEAATAHSPAPLHEVVR